MCSVKKALAILSVAALGIPAAFAVQPGIDDVSNRHVIGG